MYHFIHPFTCIVAGPTGCGKSNFVTTFIKNADKLCNVGFRKIIWCYAEMQPLYNLNNVHYCHGLPDISLFDGNQPELIIIDDLMCETDERVVNIFTKGSHHRNISIFYITQNLFHQGKGQRDISLNASYIIYFKNPRDKRQIQYIAQQVCPENSKFIQDAYNDSTNKPYGYLMMDLKQTTLDSYRFKTLVLPTDKFCYVYVPQKGFKLYRSKK